MKKATIKLVALSRVRGSFTSISRNLKSQISSSLISTNPIPQHHSPNSQSFSSSSSCTHFKSCPKSQGLLYSPSKPHHFHKTPSQNFNTHVETPPQLSSRQRKLKERSQIEEQFEAANTAHDMLEAFKHMEANFDETDLGLACLKIGLKLDQEGDDPEKILTFATRALFILDSQDGNSLPVAMTLQLLGSTYSSLKKFTDALGFLNRANKTLGKLQEEGSFSSEDIMPILHVVQLELANTKTAMGRREEALENLRKVLKIRGSLYGKDSREAGNAYREMTEAYVAILNFKEALPYCLKALEIHTAHSGQDSVEVARDRRLLGVIYTGMEEHKKALEQNQLAKKVLKNEGRSSDLLRAEIDAANMQIALGKFEAAINTLKGVVQQTDKDSENRALIFITMAKALVSQDKYDDAKRCLEIAAGILSKKESEKPLEVSEAYVEISMQYETMNEFEEAISLLKRAHALLERLPQQQHSEGSISARIGQLLLLTGNVAQAIPYLKSAAETLKECFGDKYYGVGYIYNNLGAAYLELDRPQSAAQMYAVAKDIMDASLGPHHADSIEACQNLSKAYAAIGSYELAIKFQQKTVEALKEHRQNAEDEIEEAGRVLVSLKLKAMGSSSGHSTPKALPPSSKQ